VSVLAVDLADRALAVARDGQVLGTGPSVVFDGSTGERAGTPAWHALRRTPTAVSTRHLAQVMGGGPAAAPRARRLLAAEMLQRLSPHVQAGDSLWIAAPASATAGGLSVLLGLLRDEGLAVEGFVDAAIAQAAALALERAALVIELGLHHLAVTLVERTGQHFAPRRVVVSAGGWLEVLRAWTELVGRTLVKQTRFDPLRDGASEQQLLDVLPQLAARAMAEGAALVDLGPAQPSAVMISRDQLAQAGQGLRREIMQLLHGLRPAGRPLCLLAPEALLAVPGLAEDLDSLAGCDRISVPDGFAALALPGLVLPARTAGAAVRLVRRLPGGAPALTEGTSRVQLGARRVVSPPSHVLLGGEAHPLEGAGSAGPSSIALVVGCDPGEEVRAASDARVLRLGPGLAGVSRRHCTFLRSGGEIVLLDHSRFGTFVNGERVAERVAVRAGDRVRLGDPGVELALIAVGGSSAPAQALPPGAA
jgi:hypothetical protein